jgi:predicted PurR-regulated permease PerM
MSSAVKKETFSNDQVRIMMLEQRNENFVGSLNRIEKSIVDLKVEVLTKIDKVEKELSYKIDKVDSRVDKLDNRMDSNFKWVLGIIFTQFATLFGVMAHGFHWL